ncbi:MAG TPA: acyl-CoA dehydrogenase family protein [Frankiaceae bacterium]|nr:acyl-CoA dehydrogenase family protein [Frankiaceae bacterium]
MQRTVYNEEHEAFREVAREFVERQVLPRIDTMREHREIDRATWQAAGKQGLLGVGVPEEFGGGGVDDFRFNSVFNEELSRISAALGSSFSIHADIVAPYLIELTNDDQKARWLPKFCSGELITAIGMTEPSGGSDLASLRTTAKRDGDSYIVNGSKTFITNGYNCDLVVLAVRTGSTEDRARGVSLLAVEAGAEGFTRGRKLHKIGQPEADTAELFFDNVRVPVENLLGEQNRGFPAMMTRLAQERLSCALSNVAHAKQVLDDTLVYVKERKAFGSSVGSFQANKHRLADLITQIDVARAFCDACLDAHVRGQLSAVDAAKAKLWSSEAQNTVIDACVQLYGGYGYMQEYSVAQAWADARVSRIWAGSNEIMREIIGRDLGL